MSHDLFPPRIQTNWDPDYEKKIREDAEKNAEKRISAEIEAKQAQAKAEEKRRQQEREKENTTPPHSSGTSNIGEEQRRHGRRGNSPRWREYDDYGEPSGGW